MNTCWRRYQANMLIGSIEPYKVTTYLTVNVFSNFSKDWNIFSPSKTPQIDLEDLGCHGNSLRRKQNVLITFNHHGVTTGVLRQNLKWL